MDGGPDSFGRGGQTTTPAVLLTELTDNVLRLTLNDVPRRNALSENMLASLQNAIDDAPQTSARVIIIAAHGPVFCAGHDLKELTAARAQADRGRAYFTDIMKKCSSLMQAITNCPLPIIAEVSGTATAAGCQLVASCDLAYADRSAQFCTPGVHIGLFCSTPMVALSRNVPSKFAMEMLLTGDMIAAERAAEIGLINKVVDVGLLRAETLAVAQKIASKARRTLATGKNAFYQQREKSLSEAYDYASTVMVDNMLQAEAKEGIGAFLEKRPACWPQD